MSDGVEVTHINNNRWLHLLLGWWLPILYRRLCLSGAGLLMHVITENRQNKNQFGFK